MIIDLITIKVIDVDTEKRVTLDIMVKPPGMPIIKETEILCLGEILTINMDVESVEEYEEKKKK